MHLITQILIEIDDPFEKSAVYVEEPRAERGGGQGSVRRYINLDHLWMHRSREYDRDEQMTYTGK